MKKPQKIWSVHRNNNVYKVKALLIYKRNVKKNVTKKKK
jgi:hypothetical protein